MEFGEFLDFSGPELKTYINVAKSNGIWRSLPRQKQKVYVIIGNSSILIDLQEKCVSSRKCVEFTEMSGSE